MLNKKLILSAVFFLILRFSVQAQESINTAGENAIGSGGSASWTIGQVFCQTHTGTNGSIAQGVQHAYKITTVNAVDEAKAITLSVTAFPNPVTNYFILSINEFDISNLSFQLFDLSGKLLLNKEITSNNTIITIDNFKPATYLVKVMQKNKEVKTFKVIKAKEE